MENPEFVEALANRRLLVCVSFGYEKALSLLKLWLQDDSESVEGLMLTLT